MAYTPRLSAPSTTDKYWIKSPSGYNNCIRISGNATIPNCVGYAWGRFMEIGGVTTCKLSTRNAEKWWGNTADGYARGQTPKLGAVICWRKGSATDGNDGAGHVAIVEQINSDGSIVTSNSAYNGKRFYTQTLKPPLYTWNSAYTLQGFIYNPYVEAAPNTTDLFVKAAEEQLGSGIQFVRNKIGFTNGRWDAAFITACAASVSDTGIPAIPNASSGGAIVSVGVSNNLGTFNVADSPFEPKMGDLILLRYRDVNYIGYTCDHIGIVQELVGNLVTAIIGDYGSPDFNASSVQRIKISTDSSIIYGYYRPNWLSSGGGSDQIIGQTIYTSLYNTKNTVRDATLRISCYMDSSYTQTLQRTAVPLASVNYTGVLGAFFTSMMIPAESDVDVILDGIQNQNARIITRYLLDKGLNVAASVGILANIQQLSFYMTGAAMENTYSIGICRWSGSRADLLKSTLGSTWDSDLSGQCDYLWYELTSSYSELLTELRDTIKTNTVESAVAAGQLVMREYRGIQSGAAYDSISGVVSELWGCIVIQLRGSCSEPTDTNMSVPDNANAVYVPAWVKQSGITGNYTNYTYWYDRWSRSSIQYQLSRLWNAQGRPNSRGIATLGGNYLCAVTLIFGTTGDRITIVLDDGTQIPAIIADSKGADPSKAGESGNIYGHQLGGGVIDVIEWEKFGNAASRSDNTKIDLSGWGGKRVSHIINHGSYV